MNLSVEGDRIRIEDQGIGLLRLKAQITERIGHLLLSGKGFMTVPIATLPLISDLIDANQIPSDIANHLGLFNNHEKARSKALAIIENNVCQLNSTKWSTILDPAQATAVAAMITSGLLGLCLFDEQGSGKTVMTIAAFDLLKEANEIDSMIVVCPKSMITEWPKDINRFLGSECEVVVAEGDRAQKYGATQKNFDVLVTNYEGIATILVSLLATTKRYLLAVDESYYLKNEDALRSATIKKLRMKCHKCFVLCGTPAPNSAHDLVNQFNLADLGYTFGGFKKKKNPEDDWEKIASLVDTRGLFIRRLKPQILQHVPEKNFHVIRVELAGKQALMYEKARHELELELRTLSNETFRKHLTTYFQRRAALLQICTCPGVLDPTITDIPGKILVLDDLLHNLISNGRKVVLWSFYKKSLEEVFSRYACYNPVKVDGSTSTTTRREAVTLFQTDPNTMLFIGNPAAAGAGITLHASYDAIYLSYSNQAAHYLQSLDRIHRRGQVSDLVNYYLLICKNTIEETEVLRLRGKELNQHSLLGDHIPWPTSLDDALQELIGHE